MARDGEHNRRERAVRDGRAAATRRSGLRRTDGKAMACGVRTRRPAASGRHGGCARSDRMHAAVGKGKCLCFF
jgi:hypothetical protein